MAGSKRALPCKGTLPISCSLSLPVHPAPLLCLGLFALVQTLKNSGKCTDAIGEDLGIIGSVASGPDLSAVVPLITAKVSGGAVHIGWGYNGNGAWLSGLEIHVDRGDGKGYGWLTVDTTPNDVDPQPFPPGKAVWSYKAICRAEDAQVGQWSQAVSVAVGG